MPPLTYPFTASHVFPCMPIQSQSPRTCQSLPAHLPAFNSPARFPPPLTSLHFEPIYDFLMADQQQGPGPLTRQTRPGSAQSADRAPTLIRWIHEHAPNSTQMLGFLTLLISGAILLLLTGLTVTAAVTGLVFFAPIILIFSPVWVPAAVVLFIGVTGFLSACGVGVAVLAGATWMYRYKFRMSLTVDRSFYISVL